MSKNVLNTNESLRDGDSLVSSNGLWKAVFQGDGNFVIYGWKPTWASDTDGSDGASVIMQADGNLVIYNNCHVPRWDTNTYTSNAELDCRLELTNEGNLVLYKDNEQKWCSTQNRGRKV